MNDRIVSDLQCRAEVLWNEKHAFIWPVKGIRTGCNDQGMPNSFASDCEHALEGSRFRRPKSADEEAARLEETTPHAKYKK